MLEAFSSPSAADRLRVAGAFLQDIPAATEVLIVGASRAAADDLARQATIAREVTFGLHRASFMELAVRLAATEMARLGVAPAAALGVEAVAARVSFEAMRDRALTYFAPVAQFPGFARALAATLAELRLGDVAPRALHALDGPGRDVAELARRFERQLEDAKVADRAALLALAARAVAQGALEPLGRMPMLLLDVSVTGASERAFVEALAAVSPAVLATVPAGDDTTLEALRTLGARERHEDPSGAEGDLSRARHFLFAEAAPPARTASGEVAVLLGTRRRAGVRRDRATHPG